MGKTNDWINFHAPVNEDIGESLTLVITKDNVGDNRGFANLLELIVDIVGKVDADGAYDTNKDFEYSVSNGIAAGTLIKLNVLKRTFEIIVLLGNLTMLSAQKALLL